MQVNVQFDGADEKTIIAYFATPQDPAVYANIGAIDTSDARWATFYALVGGSMSSLPAPTT